MGYVSHIFMYMDIRKHINLVKNHGYEGKIGMIKKDVHGIVMLAAKAGDIVLYRPYKEDENDYEENTTKYCSIETPLSEEQIQENRINQKFVEIPFSKLVEKISYKCKLVGIDFQVHEESYTSKVDHLAFEKLGKHDVYLGKRKKRGLFQSSIGKLLNADINGAIGIGRKVFGDSYVSKIIGSGLAFNPVRVNIL